MEDEKAKEGMLINPKTSEKEKTMLTWLFSDKAETGETTDDEINQSRAGEENRKQRDSCEEK